MGIIVAMPEGTIRFFAYKQNRMTFLRLQTALCRCLRLEAGEADRPKSGSRE